MRMIEDRPNDEIKEILDFLDDDNRERPFGISNHDLKILRDYINNLQQENEKLKNRIEEITKIYQNESRYKTELETKYVQLQQAVKESINLLWKSDISTSKGLEIINILHSCLKSE